MPSTNGLGHFDSILPGAIISGSTYSAHIVAASPCVTAEDLYQVESVTCGQFTLDQNYPNPYVNRTSIPFFLATDADVRLDVLDLLGRKVAGIVRKGLRAGRHSINLNLSGLDLCPGEYVYRLQVTNCHGVFRQVKSMVAC